MNTTNSFEEVSRFIEHRYTILAFEKTSDTLLGHIAGKLRINQDTGDPYGTISMFAVDKAHRGQGVGDKLLKAILKQFFLFNAKFVTVKDNLGNQSLRFFEKYGFLAVLSKYAKDGTQLVSLINHYDQGTK